MIPFLDLSNNNFGRAGIDWPTFAKWLLALHPEAGVILKLVEGLDFVDPDFERFRDGAEAAAIQNIGYYSFLRPSQGSGADHADFFYQTLGKFGGAVKNCFYVGDAEDTKVNPNADLDPFMLDWDGRMTRPAGFHTITYTGKWYTDPHNLNRDPKLAQMGLWWCAPDQATIPAVPEPWRSAGKSILLWQYNWHGHVPGIEGEVDLDWLVGPIETLRPYQMGYAPDPLAGQSIDVPPDVAVDPKSESLTDAQTIVTKATADLVTLAGRLAGDDQRAALTVKADLDALTRLMWNH